mgnify:CR=1 FL=1
MTAEELAWLGRARTLGTSDMAAVCPRCLRLIPIGGPAAHGHRLCSCGPTLTPRELFAAHGLTGLLPLARINAEAGTATPS